MASSEELADLFKNGQLRKLLIRAFGGSVKTVGKDGDFEFILNFENGVNPPSAEAIAKTVTHHYRSIGYTVENSEVRDDYFGALICHNRTNIEGRVISVLITTNYISPELGGKNGLRVGCEILR